MAMSKVKKVKQHLEQGKRINALTGFALFGTMRMSAIIHNLKNKHGMDIETEMKTSPAGVRYASYQLANYTKPAQPEFQF